VIVDPRTGAVAAAHAGWRGTVAGVLPAVVRALVDELGARPDDLRVVLGPAIGACCFEVGRGGRARVRDRPGRPPRGRRRHAVAARCADKWHIDLKAANRILLERAGVSADAVDAVPTAHATIARASFPIAAIASPASDGHRRRRAPPPREARIAAT
jgi:copper oxidase (laccase) domain-containing protein